MYSITEMLNWYMDVERNSHFKIQQILSTANTHEYNFRMLMDGSIDFWNMRIMSNYTVGDFAIRKSLKMICVVL